MLFHKKIEAEYKKQLFCRYDDSGLVNYFSYKDFKDLTATPHSFTTPKGDRLQGYFYQYPNANKSPLVVFDHGMGGGHRSYMQEIETLCHRGYRVYAYDHTGCMESEGENVGGFSGSLPDLDACLRALKNDPNINTEKIYVMGHSWGGYATINIPALHPDVEKIVVLCGFTSVEKMIEQNFKGPLALYRKDIMKLEKASNPSYCHYDAVNTLQNANTKALLIYSEDDKLVQRLHYDRLYEAFRDKEGIHLILTQGKGHNPNYTKEAVALLSDLGEKLKTAQALKTSDEKQSFKNSFDWQKITEQDEALWNKIFAFLED